MAQAESNCGHPLATLMERAGAAVAEAVWRFGAEQPTLILCGPGNNGGDGYVAARLLRERGLDVHVAALGAPKTDLAIAAHAAWNGDVEPLDAARPSKIIVDALFGTGLTRPLSPGLHAQMKDLFGAANYRFAVDLPSGIGTDDGADLGAQAVDFTLALGALKPAHLLYPARAKCGTIKVADIGILADSELHVLSRPKLVAPAHNMHKYARGFAAIIGGKMAGAALLSAKAAMPLAGYVALIGARRIGPDALIHRHWAEIADDSRVGALLIGPGLGRDQTARDKLNQALGTTFPLVLDADALMIADVAALAMISRALILTPHEGEFAHLFPDVEGSKIGRARAAALRAQAVIVYKGPDTIIAAPDGRACIATDLPGWLASAGTGDVLAGIITARLAACDDPFQAACEGVWLHGAAARLAGPAFIADDLIPHIKSAVTECL